MEKNTQKRVDCSKTHEIYLTEQRTFSMPVLFLKAFFFIFKLYYNLIYINFNLYCLSLFFFFV